MIQSEWRLVIFLLSLALFVGLEWVHPRRTRRLARSSRWPANIGLMISGFALTAGLALTPFLKLSPLMFADHVTDAGFGLFGYLQLPVWLEIVFAFVLLDMLIYAQHVVFHKVEPLWRLHRVHHSDLDLDASSALRFHPLEILLSLGIKLGVIIAIGAHPLAVFCFEVALSSGAMFNHANLHIPDKVDRWLRRLIVTPDMHRIHHSRIPEETDANFGFFLSVWDRLFKTFLHDPAGGQSRLVLGMHGFERSCGFLHLLKMPFTPRQR